MKINSSDRRATIEASALSAAMILVAASCAPANLPTSSPVGRDDVPLAPAGGRSGPVDFAFESLDERPITAEATRGKPTVLTFVTTASLAAQAQVDFLVAMAKNDGDRVHYGVVAVDDRDSREMVELYKKSLSIPFPVALADAQTLAGAGAFGDVRAVPVTVVLDRRGRIVWRVDGRLARSDELRAAMRGL
ncbi:MAG: TlpA disulfide reductase family protein [Polyangiaceae bacterium]